MTRPPSSRAQIQGRLKQAVVSGDAAAVKSLLDAGCEPNLADENGASLLVHAAARGHEEVCRLLLAHGVDRYRLDCFGKDASDYARRNGYDHVAEAIGNFSLDIDAPLAAQARASSLDGGDFSTTPVAAKMECPVASELSGPRTSETAPPGQGKYPDTIAGPDLVLATNPSDKTAASTSSHISSAADDAEFIPKPPMLGQATPPTAEIIDRKRILRSLIEDGKVRGYLTTAEISERFPEGLRNADSLSKIHYLLRKIGIQIVNNLFCDIRVGDRALRSETRQ